MPYDLAFDEQVAVVTGAGRAIGRVHALELGRRGARVIVNDLIGENAAQVVAEIRAEGGEAESAVADVGTPDGGREIVESALERFGDVHVVINNAGILRPGYFGELSAERIEQVLAVNLLSAFWVTQAAWDTFKRNRYGRVIVTSSGSGMLGHHGLANYAAAKAGLYGLVKALSFEGRDHGIGVNAVLPMATGQQAERNPIPDYDRFPPVSALADRRDPRLVTALVVYLASRECEISGEAFSTVGARYARVFVGIARGWLAPDVTEVTPERIAEHLTQIRDLADFSVPTDQFDELVSVNAAVGSLNAELDQPPSPSQPSGEC